MQYFENFPLGKQNEEKILSEASFIHETCIIRESSVGDWVSLDRNTCLIESSIDDYSYADGDVQIIYSEIGKYCSIANSVRINPGNHPKWRVTQHHMTYRRKQYQLDSEDDLDFFKWRRDQKCIIGHDVWIGHAAVIMPGVRIGTGAVIGSGAVVTKEIGPYEIAVGVPARVIKKRFDDNTIAKLLKSEWWNWDRATLENNFKDLFDLDLFLKVHC